MNSVRALARTLGLGGLALRYVRQPAARTVELWRDGGPRQRLRTEEGRRAMIAAAATLPAMSDPGNALPVKLNFLSGEKYWHQTLFCLVSIQQAVARRVDAVIYDDGSFTTATKDQMRKTIPWLQFVSAAETDDRLAEHLPEQRFPRLRAQRLVYPHLRKLTDIHCAARDWTLVLDSDMLMFRRPDALLAWMDELARPIYMQDVKTAYGYSPRLLRSLAGAAVPPRVNVGLYAVNGTQIDWDRIESWCARQLDEEGPNYLQEQALTAMMLADMAPQPLAAADYVVLPSLAEGRNPQAVLHHYVAHAKRSYYQYGWQRIAARADARDPVQTAIP